MVRKWIRRLLRVGWLTIALLVAYTYLLCTPQPFFSYSVRAEGITLYADRPLPKSATQNVLRLSRQKLAASSLHAIDPNPTVFICNSRWRQFLFFNKHYGVAGVSPYPLTTNVFLRDASLDTNRLISPRGVPVPGDRTLDYFVAHEITHELTGRAIGPWRFYRMPQWVREGYADYVGKGASFNYTSARNAFLTGTFEMNFERSGQYCRFHLLVAYLLDHRGWTVDRLLRGPWPDQQRLEAAIRMGE